jgi:hypothetical protein
MVWLPPALDNRPRADKANTNDDIRCNAGRIIAGESMGGKDGEQAGANPDEHMGSHPCGLVATLSIQADDHTQEGCPDKGKCGLRLKFEWHRLAAFLNPFAQRVKLLAVLR